MDLLRHIGWLRVLTVLLVALGSTAVGAEPRGPSGIPAGLGSGGGQGTVSGSGFSVVVTSNAVGLMDVGSRGTENGGVDGAALSGWSGVLRPLHGGFVAFARPRHVPAEERPLRHRLCVYRL